MAVTEACAACGLPLVAWEPPVCTCYAVEVASEDGAPLPLALAVGEEVTRCAACGSRLPCGCADAQRVQAQAAALRTRRG